MRKIIIFLLLSLFPVVSYAQSPLCSSYPTNFCCEYVSSVTINGQTYSGSTGYTAGSGGTGPNGYYDYTGGTAVPTITAGQNITITYTAQTNGNYMEYFKLWVDFNGNGVLSDPGEQVYAYNVAWTGTKTVTSTFQVPTSVFNGQVYMRFMMVYANVPALCGSYAYGNTFDFVTNITGAVDPFNYSGYVYDAEGNGISNLPVKFFNKVKSTSNYSLYGTYLTDSNGRFEVVTSLDAADYDFKLKIDSLSFSNPSTIDATYFNQKIFLDSFESKDYYRMDVTNNNNLNIADVYWIYRKINGGNWFSGVPTYRMFTEPEWDSISNSTSNLKSIYPGTQSITVDTLSSGDSTIIHIIKTGHHD